METRSMGSVKEWLIKTNQYHEYHNEHELRRAQMQKHGSMPLFFHDHMYVGNVTVGTPGKFAEKGQTVFLMMDTGSSNVWMIDAMCHSLGCNGIYGNDRRKFNSTKSSSFSSENTTLNLQYRDGWCKGPLVTDTISLGGLQIEQQGFVNVMDIELAFGFMYFDGMLGLGWPNLSMGEVPPPMQNILPSLDSPVFTIWNDGKFNNHANAGLITFGAIDTVNCHSEINYVPLTSETYWQFAIDGFSVGNYSEHKIEQAISDSGTLWFGVPKSVMDAVVKETHADFFQIFNFYFVDCSTIEIQPDLVFTINGVKYIVTPQEYIKEIGLGRKFVSALSLLKNYIHNCHRCGKIQHHS
ncbi:Inositol hexakisphosphate and diphosphoinositol-pentakisphosphate kinase [Parelaphostrongylus tenuis]|uniref:Inositol hexakisphosphate and diphosphoinositol-pentakisphosphate kinase n=1 Tax=Parelaphostrongylus tenuis TaxID=148309 RepID=A0AAD5RBA9_PARTN|nr:Inositol hexakisphosphate and diphosphoinositol-pentakisphosphate kinase [Parelaphostrongylus tenuis]